ncbi:MAG: hypothetical protein R3F55_16385 [Alphaproteobacteria bacterium]
MIDNLMREVGIEGGGVGRLTDVVQDARDLAQLRKRREGAEADSDRERDRREEGVRGGWHVKWSINAISSRGRK